MKHLFIKLSVLLSLFILFTSCSSSIMKRHYRKGFYVDFHKHKTSQDVAAQNKTEELTKATIAAAAGENADLEKINPANDRSTENSSVKAPETTAAKHKMNIKKKEAEVSQQEADDAIAISSSPSHKKAFSIMGLGDKEKEAGAVGAALSLMWIVVLIIFAAYIISLFAVADLATSGWVHIIGALALILLILWLLRVV